jgi:hypothetical protein
MNQKVNYLLFIAFFGLLITSCKKEEGYGGKATITGIVKERIYDKDFSVFQKEVASVDENVFIEFGDDDAVGDDVKTSASGAFEFNCLLPGTYRIYIYSEDSVTHTTNKKTPVIKEVHISSSDKTINIGDLTQFKTINVDDGTSSAEGVIGAQYYAKNYALIIGKDYAKDQDVYLIYNNRSYSETRIRTLYNGKYAFSNLIKGKYQIFTYSENTDNSGIYNVITKNFEITQENQVVKIDSITVNIQN